MLLHAKQGVDEGIKENGVPVEVMGCLVGYADIDEPGFVVITDCFEVPCKGGPHSAEMDRSSNPCISLRTGLVMRLINYFLCARVMSSDGQSFTTDFPSHTKTQ